MGLQEGKAGQSCFWLHRSFSHNVNYLSHAFTYGVVCRVWTWTALVESMKFQTWSARGFQCLASARKSPSKVRQVVEPYFQTKMVSGCKAWGGLFSGQFFRIRESTRFCYILGSKTHHKEDFANPEGKGREGKSKEAWRRSRY